MTSDHRTVPPLEMIYERFSLVPLQLMCVNELNWKFHSSYTPQAALMQYFSRFFSIFPALLVYTFSHFSFDTKV